MNVHQYKNKIEITFQYTPTLVSFVKSLDGREYNASRKSWFIPLAGSNDNIRRLADRGFNIDTDLWQSVKTDEETAKEAEAIAVMPDTEFVSSLPLYNYQRVGAAFLYKIGSGILGDQPGLGKTIMSLAVCEKARSERVLILCPAVLKYQWGNEIKKFLPEASVVVIDGSAAERIGLWREDHRFYIANYELLLRDLPAMAGREWDHVIADECTKISNPRAKTSKYIKKIPAKNKIAMSGTLISNKAEDVWNILDWVAPGCAGNFWNFMNTYCVRDRFGGISGYQNMAELKKKLGRYMIRRLKTDVLPELPDKIETDMPFVLSDEERVLQTKIKKELLFEIDKADISKIDKPMNLAYTIAKFQRLRMLADSLELLGDKKTSSKMDVLKEIMAEHTDDKVIIFSEFAEMCKLLHRDIPGSVMIIGDTSGPDRAKIVETFNKDEACKVLVMSSAGMFGLNLQAATVVINYDLPFSLAKVEQRIGRAHRMGQKRTVMVYNLIGKGTADMAIRTIIHAKAELSGQLLGDIPLTMSDIRAMIEYE